MAQPRSPNVTQSQATPSSEAMDLKLDEHIDLWRTSDYPRNLLSDLCSAIRSPCGIEVAIESAEDMLKGDVTTPGPHAGMRRATPLKHVTPREVLNRISTLSPNYTWTLSKSVINLIPKPGKGWEKDRKSVLDKKLGQALMISNARVEEAMKLLFNHVGIKLPVASVATPYIGPPAPPRPPVSLTCSEKESVRECLNDIVSTDGQVMWIFGPKRDRAYQYDISRHISATN